MFFSKIHKRSKEELKQHKKQPDKKPVVSPHDIISEQHEQEYTTKYSPECITDLKLLAKNPQDYIEINIIRTSRIVDTFAISATHKYFRYKTKKYSIDEKFIYLLPTKQGYLIPTCFYTENDLKPVKFQNSNKGITGKALSLLYMPQLYEPLFAGEDSKYNLFIVILSIACLIAFGFGCYLVLSAGG